MIKEMIGVESNRRFECFVYEGSREGVVTVEISSRLFWERGQDLLLEYARQIWRKEIGLAEQIGPSGGYVIREIFDEN